MLRISTRYPSVELNLLSVHDIISLEMDAQFLMGGFLSLSSLLGSSSGLGSLLLSLEFLFFGEGINWDSIGKGIFKLLGRNFVLSSEEILDLSSALLEVI